MPNEKSITTSASFRTKDCRKRWYFRGFWSRCRVLQLGVITWFSLDEVRKTALFFFLFEIVVEAFADWQRGTCTFLTTLSLSAIATNGKIAGGGAYYLCLGMCLVIFCHSVFRGATMFVYFVNCSTKWHFSFTRGGSLALWVLRWGLELAFASTWSLGWHET